MKVGCWADRPLDIWTRSRYIRDGGGPLYKSIQHSRKKKKKTVRAGGLVRSIRQVEIRHQVASSSTEFLSLKKISVGKENLNILVMTKLLISFWYSVEREILW